ncbi:hypothetical protein AVV30_gp096 [Vibrio phage phi 1]|uniref:Uncharacterized protein n=1 Tax=Vibrio phage phi 1 TaxID=1589297 RepID=A0A0B5HAJ5_9CAUD|nr:hypothetical protein AVV30_gp096 [Vibrio phage phi 1]AJF40754.1 hypothetical protein SBVP1_0096 [Vibrio phage phi 1]
MKLLNTYEKKALKPLKDVLSFWYLDKWYVQELYKTPAR